MIHAFKNAQWATANEHTVSALMAEHRSRERITDLVDAPPHAVISSEAPSARQMAIMAYIASLSAPYRITSVSAASIGMTREQVAANLRCAARFGWVIRYMAEPVGYEWHLTVEGNAMMDEVEL